MRGHDQAQERHSDPDARRMQDGGQGEREESAHQHGQPPRLRGHHSPGEETARGEAARQPAECRQARDHGQGHANFAQAEAELAAKQVWHPEHQEPVHLIREDLPARNGPGGAVRQDGADADAGLCCRSLRLGSHGLHDPTRTQHPSHDPDRAQSTSDQEGDAPPKGQGQDGDQDRNEHGADAAVDIHRPEGQGPPGRRKEGGDGLDRRRRPDGLGRPQPDADAGELAHRMDHPMRHGRQAPGSNPDGKR